MTGPRISVVVTLVLTFAAIVTVKDWTLAGKLIAAAMVTGCVAFIWWLAEDGRE